MLEKHEREQYFWTVETVSNLADVASRFENPCCLCVPLVGVELEKRQIEARVLDIDERFEHVAGFQRYDLYRPTWLGQKFGVILCDPPFWIVSLSQLFGCSLNTTMSSRWRSVTRNDAGRICARRLRGLD